MSDIKIVLKRSPGDPENGVWIDGVKQQWVQKVEVTGQVRNVPTVTITVIPTRVDMEIEGTANVLGQFTSVKPEDFYD